MRFYGQHDSSFEPLDLDHKFVDETPLKSDLRPNLIKVYELIDSNTDFIVPSFISLASSANKLKEIVTRVLKLGATITFIKEGLTLTASSQVELKLLSSMADFEQDVRSILRRDGIQTAINSGKTVGRKKTLSAEDQAKVIQRIKDRENIQNLADEYNISRTTLYKYVQDLDWWKSLQEKRKRPQVKTNQAQTKSKKLGSKRKLTVLSFEKRATAIQRIKEHENIQKLATELNVSRTTLYNLVKDLDWWKTIQEKRKRTN